MKACCRYLERKSITQEPRAPAEQQALLCAGNALCAASRANEQLVIYGAVGKCKHVASSLKGQANKSLDGSYVAHEPRSPAKQQALWCAGNVLCAASRANEQLVTYGAVGK